MRVGPAAGGRKRLHSTVWRHARGAPARQGCSGLGVRRPECARGPVTAGGRPGGVTSWGTRWTERMGKPRRRRAPVARRGSTTSGQGLYNEVCEHALSPCATTRPPGMGLSGPSSVSSPVASLLTAAARSSGCRRDCADRDTSVSSVHLDQGEIEQDRPAGPCGGPELARQSEDRRGSRAGAVRRKSGQMNDR